MSNMTIRLDDDLVVKLDALVSHYGVASRPHAIREIIDRGLDTLGAVESNPDFRATMRMYASISPEAKAKVDEVTKRFGVPTVEVVRALIDQEHAQIEAKPKKKTAKKTTKKTAKKTSGKKAEKKSSTAKKAAKKSSPKKTKKVAAPKAAPTPEVVEAPAEAPVEPQVETKVATPSTKTDQKGEVSPEFEAFMALPEVKKLLAAMDESATTLSTTRTRRDVLGDANYVACVEVIMDTIDSFPDRLEAILKSL